MSKQITVNFNDNISKSYNISVNWQSNEKAHIRHMEGFYAPICYMLEEIALSSKHIVSNISSFTVNGKILQTDSWDITTVQSPQPRDFYFSEQAIDEFARELGIRGEDEGFGNNDVVDLTGALLFEAA